MHPILSKGPFVYYVITCRGEGGLGIVFCNQNCSDLQTVRKNCYSDREKLLKFKAEGQESLEQFIQTVKDQNNFW